MHRNFPHKEWTILWIVFLCLTFFLNFAAVRKPKKYNFCKTQPIDICLIQIGKLKNTSYKPMVSEIRHVVKRLSPHRNSEKLAKDILVQYFRFFVYKGAPFKRAPLEVKGHLLKQHIKLAFKAKQYYRMTKNRKGKSFDSLWVTRRFFNLYSINPQFSVTVAAQKKWETYLRKTQKYPVVRLRFLKMLLQRFRSDVKQSQNLARFRKEYVQEVHDVTDRADQQWEHIETDNTYAKQNIDDIARENEVIMQDFEALTLELNQFGQ